MRIALILLFLTLSGFASAQEPAENDTTSEEQTNPESSAEEDLTFETAEEPIESVENIDLLMKSSTSEAPSQQSNSDGAEDVFGEVIEYIENEEELIEQEKKRTKLELSKKFSDRVRDFHTELSEDIVSIADTIDSFFINRPITDGRNRTNIRLTNTTNWVEGDGVNNDFDFKLRLRLPHLKRKIQIEFEDDSLVDDTAASRDNFTSPVTGASRTQQQGGSRGALSFYDRFIGIDTKLSSGIEVRNEVIVFGRFRVSRDFLLTPKQKITFIHDVFDDTTDNRGQIGILNYDYTFNKFYLLRFVNEETYRDISNTFTTTHGLSLYQQISDRNFLSYNYRAESINPEARSTFYLNSHVLNVSFRRRLYREHLYYETGPGMIFPKWNKFEGLWAFIFKVEIIFGNI